MSDVDYAPNTNAFSVLKDKIYFHQLPSYANKIFYSLGFMALTSLALLTISGLILAFMGPSWWLTDGWGIFTRSVHEWAVQAFIAVLILHILVGFTTGAFRPPRRMVWVFGAAIFCISLVQTEFGYALLSDFSSQYREISGADFWNGSYLGHWINPLNYSQDFAIHVAIIPIIIFGLFICHYVLVHTFGISKPYSPDVPYRMVPADHVKMYTRGGVLAALVIMMAVLFPSPFVSPITITDIAKQDPELLATTLFREFAHTSGTATYLDSIDPYEYDTRQVYVVTPYEQYHAAATGTDAWTTFAAESPEAQASDIAQAARYFGTSTPTASVTLAHEQSGIAREQRDALSIVSDAAQAAASSSNPVIAMISTVTGFAAGGSYESVIDQENPSGNYTYSINLLRDTGVLDTEAAAVHITTGEWGMVREETGSAYRLPPGSWWFTPIGVLNSTLLVNDSDGDRDGSWILFGMMLIFIFFPFIPYLNRLPEKINLAPLIWR